MTNNFEIIYKILKSLEKAMDYEEFDISVIGYQRLGISENRWKTIIGMLVDDGYITGVVIQKDFCGTCVNFIDPKITMKGLEYLENNYMMKKVQNIVKGIIEVVK